MGFAGLVLGAALVAYVATALAHRATVWGMLDLQVYRSGGAAALHGNRLYDQGYEAHLPFTYPPFAALIFEPLSLVRIGLLKLLMTMTTIAALVATVWLAVSASARSSSWPRRLTIALGVSAAALWLEPVQENLRFGQVNVLLMLLVVADLLRPDERRWKGVGVGIAAGFKLTPLIFIAYLLFTGRIRAAFTAGGAFLATIVAGALFLPHESKRFWIDHLFLDPKRVGGVAFVANQSLQGALARLANGVDPAAPYWRPLALVVAVVGLLTATRAYRRRDELAGLLVCALTGLLISPVSWSHHWVYVVPALAVAVVWALDDDRPWRWAVPVVGGLLLAAWPGHLSTGGPTLPAGLIWLAPYRNQEHRWHGIQLLVGNAEVLLGLGVLVWAVVTLARRGPPRQRAGAAETSPSGQAAERS